MVQFYPEFYWVVGVAHAFKEREGSFSERLQAYAMMVSHWVVLQGRVESGIYIQSFFSSNLNENFKLSGNFNDEYMVNVMEKGD